MVPRCLEWIETGRFDLRNAVGARQAGTKEHLPAEPRNQATAAQRACSEADRSASEKISPPVLPTPNGEEAGKTIDIDAK